MKASFVGAANTPGSFMLTKWEMSLSATTDSSVDFFFIRKVPPSSKSKVYISVDNFLSFNGTVILVNLAML